MYLNVLRLSSAKREKSTVPRYVFLKSRSVHLQFTQFGGVDIGGRIGGWVRKKEVLHLFVAVVVLKK